MCNPHHHSSDQIKQNEKVGACSTNGGEGRCVQGFGGESEAKDNTWKT